MVSFAVRGRRQMNSEREIGGAYSDLLRKARRFAAALVLVVQSAGCASDSQGVLTPVSASPQGAAHVEMLAATTRQRSADPGVVFNGERGDAVSFEQIVVSIPPNRDVGSVQWPRPGAADPARDFAVVSLRAFSPADVATWLAGHAGKGGRVLVFVHGYNTRFESSVFHFAQLVHDMGTDAATILFSWPSRGRLLDYNYDRESANYSRTDLANMLGAVASKPECQRHSGVRALHGRVVDRRGPAADRARRGPRSQQDFEPDPGFPGPRCRRLRPSGGGDGIGSATHHDLRLATRSRPRAFELACGWRHPRRRCRPYPARGLPSSSPRLASSVSTFPLSGRATR